jgi:mRNA interferase RelE/StbE
MTYTVILTPAAQRDVRKLDSEIQRRIIRKLSELAENPRMPGTLKLQGEDLYRARVGDYRILYAIDDDTVIVTVVRVRDRKDVYR